MTKTRPPSIVYRVSRRNEELFQRRWPRYYKAGSTFHGLYMPGHFSYRGKTITLFTGMYIIPNGNQMPRALTPAQYKKEMERWQ